MARRPGRRRTSTRSGVCAYQFLAGRLPHEYSSLTELALKQQEEAVEPITTHRPEVPAELDRAIRVCLEREPSARYSSTLEMARALDAGIQGEETEATRRLTAGAAAVDDLEATRALGEVTAATQAMRARRPDTSGPPRRAPAYGASARKQPAAREPRDARSGARRRRTGTFLAVLAALLAVAAVAVALLASDGGGGVDPVDQNDVQSQIDDLKQFLRDNTE